MRILILAVCIAAVACARQESAAGTDTTVVTETVAAETDSFQTTDTAHDHGQSPATTTATAPTPESARRIGLDDAVMLLERGEAVLVDVRGPGPYAAQHARGAIEIPESEIVNRIADIPMGKMIITYCT